MNSPELSHVSVILSSFTSLKQLKQIHRLLIKTTPHSLPICKSQQLLYSKFISFSTSSASPSPSSPSYLSYACSLVTTTLSNDEPPQLSLILCNAIIQAMSQSLEAFVFLCKMLVHGLVPDEYTIPYVLKACAMAQALKEGQQIHAYSVKSGLLFFNVYVKNTLMRLYAVCGVSQAAQEVFDISPQRDLVSWTTLIQAYVKAGLCREAVKAFFEMCRTDLRADERTLVIVLSAISKLGDLDLGLKIHAYIRKYMHLNTDVFLGNALIDMYLKCGDSGIARKMFDEMPHRNVVTWNSMISGLAYQGRFKEALDMFRKMQRIGENPDEVTLVSVLNSCANLGVLGLGKWVHAYIDKHQIKPDGFIGNALVDMYGKCGSIDKAFKVFKCMKKKDVYSYTTMIIGFAMHSESKQALDVFSNMSRMGVEPDGVTFVGLLTACSHGGLVEKGTKYFSDMTDVYKIRPHMEHYGCMVDLLGRAGLIDEAEEIIRNMDMEPDCVIWGALLSACSIHGKVEVGERVMENLINMGERNEGDYVLLTNMYSGAHRWRDTLKLRKGMKEKRMRKIPGCSLIEVDGFVHEFRKGDKSHPKCREIYMLLGEITDEVECGSLEHGFIIS